MQEKPGIPNNFRVSASDRCSRSSWDKVEGADGYKLFFYSSEDPEKCIKSRYAQNCGKTVYGFENGKEYAARVCAFQYLNGVEVMGEPSEKLRFVPVCKKIRSQEAVCLKVGERFGLECEHPDKNPIVSYESGDSDIASVNASGVITAKKKGRTFIKITASDGQVFRTKVSVERSLNFGRSKAVLMLAGDILCSANHQRAAKSRSYDFFGSFSGIKQTLSRADFAVGVLGTSCFDSEPFECELTRFENSAPNHNSPSTLLCAAADAGFSGLVTANNRCRGLSETELKTTVVRIKEYGMYNFGTFGDNPVVVGVKGIKVAIISCCMVSNDTEDDDLALQAVNFAGKYDREYFLELVNRSAAMGAEYIIAYQYWGSVNSRQITGQQKREARFMAESGADLIVGSHPHVVQRFSYIKTSDGRRVPCAYSLGNFLSSNSEMRENRDGVILRAELTRADGKISARLSYIPCISENRSYGAAVVPALPAHSAESRSSAERTKSALGPSIGVFAYRPKVLLSGSSVLNDIFGSGKGFRVDKTALLISQLSLGSESKFSPPEDCGGNLALEIGKDLTGYIQKTTPDFIAVDFYTAASAACYRWGNAFTDEVCYYTNSKRLRCSGFFKEHSGELAKVRPPFGESVWKPLLKQYAETLAKAMPHEKIILFRFDVGEKRVNGAELRTAEFSERQNRIIHDMEEYFIGIVNPSVVDLSGKYFALEDCECRFESEYYLDAYRAAVEIASEKGRSYIDVPDTRIWFNRVMKYYKSMSARSYLGRLLDMNNTADRIIAQTSAEFAAKNCDRLLRLKNAGNSDLTSVKEFFADDPGAEDLIRAAEIINALEQGNLKKPYDFFALAFNERFNILKTMVRLLSAQTGIAVNESSAEIVFLLLGKAQLKRYIASLNQVTIDIWGSSVSRESVNCCKGAFVGKYIVRQAPILAYEPPVNIELPEDIGMFRNNRWRRKTLEDSFKRNGFELLRDSDSRWIILDFYDLIGTAAEYQGELFETDDFIRRTDFYKSVKNQCSECYLFEKRDMKYCFEMITRFAGDISEQYGENIILIKSEPKSSYITLDYRLENMEHDAMLEIKKKFISLCEERFASVTGCFVIDISKHFYSSDKFPLGGANIVHYEEEFYRLTAEYISEILSGSEKKIFSKVNDNYLLLRELKLNR